MHLFNDKELRDSIMSDLSSIVEEVTDKIFDELRNSIETNVYGAGTPDWYSRRMDDHGLLGSFDKEGVLRSGNMVRERILGNTDSMELTPDEFVHGSNYWDRDDVRDILYDIIINGQNSPEHPRVGKLFGESGFWTEPRDFWTPIVDLIKDGRADRMIEKAFDSRGIIWKKI